MRLLLTGASGFVGRTLARKLLDEGHLVHAVLRGRGLPFSHPNLTPYEGELADTATRPSLALRDAAAGCDAAIHLVGIIREDPARGVTFRAAHVDATRTVLQACSTLQIRRYLHMSALGTRDNANAEYHRTKFEAEQLVRNSGLNWTIFRPGMIAPSDPADPGEFAGMVRNWAEGKAAPYVFMPYFGRGLLGLGRGSLVQPVTVADVAQAFAAALADPASVRKTYDLVGPTRYTWPELYRQLAGFLGLSRKRAVPIPAWYAGLLARTLPASLLPFNLSQVQMATEDNVGDPAPFRADFGWAPGPVCRQPEATVAP